MPYADICFCENIFIHNDTARQTEYLKNILKAM